MTHPTWWNDSMGATWTDARTEVLTSWDRVVGVTKSDDADISEQALAMGFGARQAFPSLKAWEGELEAMLRSDWEVMHLDQHGFPSFQHDLGWERVSAAVKHGWEMCPQEGWLRPIDAPTMRLA